MKLSFRIKFLLIFTIILLSCAFQGAMAAGNHDLDLAISLFDKNAYELAIEQLEKVLLKSDEPGNKRQVYFYLAESYKNLNNIDKARQYYRLVLSSTGFGYSDIALFELGQIAYGHQDYKAAVSDFETLSSRFPYSRFYSYARYWTAESYYKLEQYEQARPLYNDLIASSPDFEYVDYAKYALSRICIVQNNLVLAKKLLLQLNINPKPELNESVKYFLGSIYFQQGEHNLAGEILSKLNIDYPAGKYGKEIVLLLAELAFEKNAFAKAAEYYSLLLPDSIFKEAALQGRAWSYYQLDKNPEALADLSGLIGITQDMGKKSKAFYLEALIYNRTRNYPTSDQMLAEAVVSLNERTLMEKIIALEVANAYQQSAWSRLIVQSDDYLTKYPAGQFSELILFQRGIAFYKLKNYGQSLEAFKALTSPEYKQKSEFFIADIYYRNNDYAQAKVYYHDIVDNYPGHPYLQQAMYNLAWCAYQTRNYKESAKYFTGFMLKYKNSELAEKAAFLKAESQLNVYAYNDALQTLNEFISAHPGSKMKDLAMYYQAFSMYKLEKLYDAISYFNKFTRVGTDMVLVEKARYFEASAYVRLRIWDKARQLFSQLLESNPTQVPLVEVYQKLGDACYNSKDYEAALSYYRQGLLRFPDVDWGKQLQSSVIYALIKLDRLDEAKLESDKFLATYNDRAAIENLLSQIAAREKMKLKEGQ